MGRQKKEVLVSELPQGVSIGERPDHIELFTRGLNKWAPIIEHLRKLGATEDLRYDLSKSDDIKKAQFKIRYGLRHTASLMGEKRPIRFALIGSILHVWLR